MLKNFVINGWWNRLIFNTKRDLPMKTFTEMPQYDWLSSGRAHETQETLHTQICKDTMTNVHWQIKPSPCCGLATCQNISATSCRFAWGRSSWSAWSVHHCWLRHLVVTTRSRGEPQNCICHSVPYSLQPLCTAHQHNMLTIHTVMKTSNVHTSLGSMWSLS